MARCVWRKYDGTLFVIGAHHRSIDAILTSGIRSRQIRQGMIRKKWKPLFRKIMRKQELGSLGGKDDTFAERRCCSPFFS
jgi:hypothetical protein